jgi:hypothetical protein
MRKLSEENFDTIRQYNKNLSELYLMVENGCQSDITVDDMTECLECICSLIKTNAMANTSTDIHKKDIEILREIICDQAINIQKQKKEME